MQSATYPELSQPAAAGSGCADSTDLYWLNRAAQGCCVPARQGLQGSECNSLYMVKSSFHTNTLSTLRCCWFGFTWHDPFLSCLFPAACPTVTSCGRVYSKFNVQKVPSYCFLFRFLIRTLKGNGHKALQCKGTTGSDAVLLPGVLVRKHLVQTCLLYSFRVS